MWTCPVCGKEYRNKNQWHSCAVLSVDDHLRNRAPWICETFRRLETAMRALGDVTLDPVKTAVQFRAGATFLSVRVGRDHLVLEFSLGREHKGHPVYETIRISGNRFLHRAVIEEEGELDAAVLGLLREAHSLVKG